MTTDTTREGFEAIAFKCGLSTVQYEDRSYKSDRTENYWLFWRAAKADELAFLEKLSGEAKRICGDPLAMLLNRIAELRGHRPEPLKGESNVQ